MVTAMKAIETRYKNHLFRSRLEARWAVFFDALGIKWEYEPEGYELGSGVRYLPDFRVHHPDLTWVEIKPTEQLDAGDAQKCKAFQRALTAENHSQASMFVDDKCVGVYQNYNIIVGPPTEHHRFLHITPTWPTNELTISRSDDKWADCPLCGEIVVGMAWEDGDGEECLNCMNCDIRDRSHPDKPGTWFHKGTVCTTRRGHITGSPRLQSAFRAAMSARFEHGEAPR